MTEMPAEELLRALELEGTAAGAMLAPGGCDERVPGIAAELDRCVDRLVAGVAKQPTPYTQTMYVDLLMGLTLTAESLRARHSGDGASAVRHAAKASECLTRVSMQDMCSG
ncbi:hypothetical protein AB0F15_23315 [Amycolatopsis sp. NPDC026612]|uniref:hypothetical protein n=1 Tax=Amycolatopsis sp. NPDC026612 TaxID=3155466 RepID=UPI00340E6C9B